MTDCLNRGDELAIYAMCDMLKQHAFVFTHTKPWTTVDGSIASLKIPELCMMCDVRLIYLGNNKFSEVKLKPEILSPVPRPIPLKRETPDVQLQTEQSLMSLTQEVVVGILDASQSSCTLVSLPTSPQMTQIESAKKELAMKDSGETIVEPSETQPLETGTNNSVDLPLNTPEVNRSPDTNTSTSLPIKDDQCKLDQSNLVEQNSKDKFGSPQGLDKNTDVEIGTKTVETVETVAMEKADSDNSKPSAATDNPEVNSSKTVNDTIASALPTNIPGPASLEIPNTPQLPHNKPLPQQCKTVLETKRPQTSVYCKTRDSH